MAGTTRPPKKGTISRSKRDTSFARTESADSWVIAVFPLVREFLRRPREALPSWTTGVAPGAWCIRRSTSPLRRASAIRERSNHMGSRGGSASSSSKKNTLRTVAVCGVFVEDYLGLVGRYAEAVEEIRLRRRQRIVDVSCWRVVFVSVVFVSVVFVSVGFVSVGFKLGFELLWRWRRKIKRRRVHDLARRHVALADVAARGVQLDQLFHRVSRPSVAG